MTIRISSSAGLTVAEVAQALGARLIGDGHIRVTRVAHPAEAHGETDLVLATDPRLLPLLAESKARVAIIGPEAEIEPGLLDACLIVQRPRHAMAKLTALFAREVVVAPGVHPSAVVEPGAQLGDNVAIGAFAFVGANAVLGANVVLHPQTYVGPSASIGAGSCLHPGVRVGAEVRIGARCLVHFNAAIGADGFSFVTPQPGSVETAKATGAVGATNQVLERIASLGAVEIGDDVEIGANTSIDRGTIVATRVGSGTKIDNKVQIGHNVVIGRNCLICGGVGIAGSVRLGDRVVVGGASGVADHVLVGDDAVIMAMSAVGSNVPNATIVGGIPAIPRDQILESQLHIRRLKTLYRKVEEQGARLEALERKAETH